MAKYGSWLRHLWRRIWSRRSPIGSEPAEVMRKILGTKVTLILETDGRREEFPIFVDSCAGNKLASPRHIENLVRVGLPDGEVKEYPIRDCHGGEFSYEVSIHGFLKLKGNGVDDA